MGLDTKLWPLSAAQHLTAEELCLATTAVGNLSNGTTDDEDDA